MRHLASFFIAFAIGCASESPPLELASIDGLDYAVPAGWTSKDQSEHQTKIIVWSPSDNEDKESITLVRTHELPALVKTDFARIRQFLVDAQKSLSSKPSAPSQIKTKHGLVGAQIESDFVPDGSKTSYHRIHAVLIDGTSLVHVLYTARTANREVFRLVLDSLARKAG